MVGLLRLQGNEVVWEVGPGLGAITELLVGKAAQVIAFEIDWGFIRYLKDRYAQYQNFKIVQGDVVETWKSVETQIGKPDVIIGNLPYSSGSSIIISFIRSSLKSTRMIYTMQKELAARMIATPDTKSYSSFAILCQYFCRIQKHGNLAPGSFFPSPQVKSTIVELSNRPNRENLFDTQLFVSIVRTLFETRRKKLKNNSLGKSMHHKWKEDILLRAAEQENINLDLRPENLTILDYVRLANRIYLLDA